MRSVEDLAALLDVPPPTNWPPPLNDDASQRWNLDMLRRDPDGAGWGLWYLIALEPHRLLAGNIGFKGRPSNGSCEIGYSIVPEFQSRGYATKATRTQNTNPEPGTRNQELQASATVRTCLGMPLRR